LFPKEHGAYGQLLFPIATAFAIGRITLPGLALAGAGICAFIAHEPLLVLIGRRGPRAAREQGSRALRWATAFAGAALILGVLAAAFLPAAARIALILTAALAIGLGAFIAVDREHTMGGECWMSATMGAFAAPMALGAGVSTQAAATAAAALAAAFVAPTLGVHAVIAFTRHPPALEARLICLVAVIGIVVMLSVFASRGLISGSGTWAAVPASAAACGLAARPPSARRLRGVGWTLVATSTAAVTILIFTL
jgi:YwiC-like protein